MADSIILVLTYLEPLNSIDSGAFQPTTASRSIDFERNGSRAGIRRLLLIARSGARCGVQSVRYGTRTMGVRADWYSSRTMPDQKFFRHNVLPQVSYG